MCIDLSVATKIIQDLFQLTFTDLIIILYYFQNFVMFLSFFVC